MPISARFYQTATLHVPDQNNVVSTDEYGNPTYAETSYDIPCDIALTGSVPVTTDREVELNTYRILCAIDSGVRSTCYITWFDSVFQTTRTLLIQGEPIPKYTHGMVPHHFEVQATEVQP